MQAYGCMLYSGEGTMTLKPPEHGLGINREIFKL